MAQFPLTIERRKPMIYDWKFIEVFIHGRNIHYKFSVTSPANNPQGKKETVYRLPLPIGTTINGAYIVAGSGGRPPYYKMIFEKGVLKKVEEVKCISAKDTVHIYR
jgi:hypothetical protein